MAVKTPANCPRCHIELEEIRHGTAFLDRCERCTGVFFNQGEMFEALGTAADPSVWDVPETGGTTRPGEMPCPRCGSHMLLQDVAYGTDQVEIDRCGPCGGIWLDATEADRIMKIGAQLLEKARAEAEAARKELDTLGEVDFKGGGKAAGLLYRFLSLFRKKK